MEKIYTVSYSTLILSIVGLFSRKGQGEMENNAVIKADEDKYDGMIIRPSHYENVSDEKFLPSLEMSLAAWRKQNKRGIWLKIPTVRSNLISVAIKAGFSIHHAKPDYIMMTTWICDSEPNHLPHYAAHYIGVGGFVVNERNELLVVQERFTPLGKKHWKLPGGHKDPGETLAEAAIREIVEETGIPCEFISVICFRHMTGYRHGCDDIYFVCHLRPLSNSINTDANEISACKWIPIDEYVNSPIVPTNRLIVECYLRQKANGIKISTDSIPHYHHGNKDMLFYSLSSQTSEQNIPKL